MEMSQAIFFYGVFSLCAAIGLPFTSRVFSSRALSYVSAKIAGLIIFGYGIWFLSSLKMLSYQSFGFVVSLFILSLCAGILWSRDFFRYDAKHTSGHSLWRQILCVESVSIGVYVVYLFVRSFNPGMSGTESFMDMALLSASGKTDFFPFIDPWYAGKTVNYYYYGSYLMSLLSNLSRTPYAVAYNLSLGLLYSQAILLSGTLVFILTRSKRYALAGAFLVTTAGTLFFAGNCIMTGFSQVCHYTSSTRLYSPSYIINEIPSYSFTVGDLHAHMLALPFFLFNLLALYVLLNTQKIRWTLLFLLSIGLATSALINTWDVITLITVLLMVTGVKALLVRRKNKDALERTKVLFSVFITSFLILFSVVLLISPFFWYYQSPVGGLGFAPSFVALHHLSDVQWPTPLLALLGMWGVFAFGIIIALILLRKIWKQHLFLIILSFVSVGIIIGVELFFIKDIYSATNPAYFRANTTFKFGYHAWTMLSIVFVVFMAKLSGSAHSKGVFYAKRVAGIFLTVALLGGAVYPYYALKQFYFPDTAQQALTLDGSNWMKTTSRGDWDTIQYINEHIPHRAVIAEAVGDSYSTYTRITTFTGMITPMGWRTHEWTWRFQGGEAEQTLPDQTVETGWGAVSLVDLDIRTLYETQSSDEASRIIRKYSIKYVYIGDKEREAYPTLQDQKFSQIGRVVFTSQNSRLFVVE